GIQTGWSCLDVGCGAMGVIGPLSRRVGPEGHVVGLDMDSNLLAAARQYIDEEGLTNVELKQADAHKSGLEPNTFDLVHERFVLTHVPDPTALLQKLFQLAKPGGYVIVQEPDHSSWNFWPRSESWSHLLPVLEATLALRGDINIGRRTFHLLQQVGLENVTLRAGVVALQDSHPYMRMPLTAAAAMRSVMISASLIAEDELDSLIGAVEQHILNPETTMISFTTTQVWGQKPGPT
ncbi:MAG: methyltransferase domain-containing protein, partial [Anaerolineae bacterium]|nr:methyltransferase domain-containing protein [Anaerolineae bacterium]